MKITNLIQRLEKSAESVSFDEVIAVIDDGYNFTPTKFTNGGLTNEAGQNSGSCKIFAFALLQGLSESQTLHCFGDYYRHEVLQNPDAENHQNIRNFMQSGWSGINFSAVVLRGK